MARTVLGLFMNMGDAEDAIRDLESTNISSEDVSIMAGQAARALSGAVRGETISAARGAAKGAGAAAGGGLGLIAGLTSLAIPGVGSIIAAGPISAALTAAGIGAATGGIIGALASMGVPNEEAELYAEGVRRGSVLVAVRTEDWNADDVADTLERHNPEDVKKRSAEWRASGWTGGTREQTMRTSESLRTGVRIYRHESEHPVDVEVLRMAAGSSRAYGEYDEDWRSDFNSRYANRGYTYERYEPAYRFGRTWAQDENYQGRDWSTVEPAARRDWESRGAGGKWEEVKDAVRYGWDRVRGRR